MTEKQTQVVYLTATLPPRLEDEWMKGVGVKRSEMIMFRDVTTRKNVEYRVYEYIREEKEEEVKRLVEAKKEQYPSPGQIIVYCNTVKETIRWAKVLGCSAYHREVGTEAAKREILSRFTEGKEQVFTATNALGLGVDAPTVRVVIHVGMRERMRDYAQESGRAGRDGLKSEAIIMRACWQSGDGKILKERGFRPEKGMLEFVDGNGCRRIPIDREMDGRIDRLGCEVGEERCDICQGRPRGTRRRRIAIWDDGEGEGLEEEVRERRRRRRRREGGRGGGGRDGESIDDVEIGVEGSSSTMTTPYIGGATYSTPCMRGSTWTSQKRINIDSGLGLSSSVRKIVHQERGLVRGYREEEEEGEEEEHEEEHINIPSSPPIVGLGIVEGDRIRVGEAIDEQERDREEEERDWGIFERERGVMEVQRQEKIEEIRTREAEVGRLIEQLEEWKEGCMLCKARGEEGTDHEWRECGRRGSEGEEEKESMSQAVAWLEKHVKKLDNYAGCHFCRLPQLICGSWEQDERKRSGSVRRKIGSRCHWKGVLNEAVAAIMTVEEDEDVVEWIRQRGEWRGVKEEEVSEFMGRYLRMRVLTEDGLEMSGLCEFFNCWGWMNKIRVDR